MSHSLPMAPIASFPKHRFKQLLASSACFSHMSRSGATPLAASESMARVKISSTCGIGHRGVAFRNHQERDQELFVRSDPPEKC